MVCGGFRLSRVTPVPPLKEVRAHALRALALATDNAELQRELHALLLALEASSPGGASEVSFETLQMEVAEHDEAGDNFGMQSIMNSRMSSTDAKVTGWLRSTLTSGFSQNTNSASSSIFQKLTGGATLVREVTEVAAEAPSAQQGLGLPQSHWVVPEAIERCVSGELFDALTAIDEAAETMALAALGTFDHDMVALDQASNGHAMLLIGEALLARHGLYESCHLDRPTVRRFLLVLEAAYGANPYHNSQHGADVAVSIHVFLSKFGLLHRLGRLELLAAILGALCHDFNHPGTSNAHEVRLQTERARMHSDASVLERHHLFSTFTLLSHAPTDVLAPLPPAERESVRKLMIGIVLATDLSRHLDFLSSLRSLSQEHGASAAEAAKRPWRTPFADPALADMPLLLAVAVKWADLGHCCKTSSLHKMWTDKVTEEFYALGDREKALGVPLSPMCDRQSDTNIARTQLGFFTFVIAPFYGVVADLVDPKMTPWLRVQANWDSWRLANVQASGHKLRAAGHVANLSRSYTTWGGQQQTRRRSWTLSQNLHHSVSPSTFRSRRVSDEPAPPSSRRRSWLFSNDSSSVLPPVRRGSETDASAKSHKDNSTSPPGARSTRRFSTPTVSLSKSASQ